MTTTLPPSLPLSPGSSGVPLPPRPSPFPTMNSVENSLPEISSHGRKTYFYHENDENSSTWFLSSQDIEQIVEYYESTFLEDATSDYEIPNGNVVTHPEVHESQDKEMNYDDDEDELTKDRWVVKLHPDCGLVYYTDSLSELSSWTNPFAPGIDNEIFEKINIDSEHKPPPVDEAEKLAGYDEVPNRAVFLSNCVKSSKSRITNWIQKEHLRVHDDYAAMLNYPEYLTVNPQALTDSTAVQIAMILPKGLSDDNVTFTTKHSLSESVAVVMDVLFKKYFKMYARALDEAGTDGYIFKVVGFQEYILHMDFPLGYYDCAISAARDKQKLELLLIKLTPAELMDVGPIIELNSQYYLDYCQETRRPDGDRWTEDEQALHAELTSASMPKNDDSLMSHISKDSINWPFRVLVQGVSSCPTALPCDFLQVEVNLFFNGESLLPNPCATHPVPFSSDPRFPQFWIDTKLEIASLPPTTRIAFTLVGTMKTVPGQPPALRQVIAGVTITLVDYQRQIVTGEMVLNMFPDPELQRALDPIKYKHEATPELLNLTGGVPVGNGVCNAGALYLTFDSYSVPVVAEIPTLNAVKALFANSPITKIQTPDKQELIQLEQILHSDPLRTLSHEDKKVLYKNREFCSQNSRYLAKFLQSINWAIPDRVHEAYRCLVHWAKPSPLDALELLDIRYSDPVVREYALRLIDEFSDSTLQEFLLQLVQVLKYEAYHDSPLARLLLRRALRAPLTIGHAFFWMIRSEMHCSNVLERFGTLLVLYLLNCGPHEISLNKQAFVNDKIKAIADYIKTLPSKEKRIEEAKSLLNDLNKDLPPRYCLCLTPKIECCAIKSQKCKVMDSKKLPLWIVFQNADPYGKDFYTIFKSGDDLRQDQITLQLLRIMDVIWRGIDPTMRIADIDESPLDLKLKPYKCCSTGHDLGMIEVVVDSDTTANIITKYGGKLTGAFSSTPIDIYLREHNQHGLYPTAVENFVRTCAGYCVATYVLGIGDRHAGNIMVSNSGHLFHIDFGHFLGNFKSKYGINRERAPFVFTPAMAYIMRDTRIAGATYQDFERMCCEAYNMLRRRASLFINLFILMVPAAMPELLVKSDISYLQEMLSLELTIEQADVKFIGEIKNSLNTVSRQIDNWFHTLKH